MKTNTFSVEIDSITHDVLVCLLYDALDSLEKVDDPYERLQLCAELNHACDMFGC